MEENGLRRTEKNCHQMQCNKMSSGKPHVSQERSSCFRLFLNFWVSLRSCRLFWVTVPFFPFFPFFLVLTGEGTGGLIPLSFEVVYSSSCDILWVSLWTCRRQNTLKPINRFRDGAHFNWRLFRLKPLDHKILFFPDLNGLATNEHNYSIRWVHF